MKIWEKGQDINNEIIRFTAGSDQITDLQLAPFDVFGSIAHAIMLESVKILTINEKKSLIRELLKIYDLINKGTFSIDEGVEDIHSQLEKILTEKLGDAGKKIHTARSRNDQVITCLKLLFREKLTIIFTKTVSLAELLIQKSEESKDILIPGYTHTQVAMPSSFGLWFGAYAESLVEDLFMLDAAFRYVNLSPLGSAAGYGSGFPVDRWMTSKILEFDDLHVNSINAQLSRGKTERYLMMSLSGLAYTLAKLADDMVLFMCQNFNFFSLSDDLTTGSSIMPHKKNPDVAELVRAKCNGIQGKMSEVMYITTGLTSGYHRDYQQLKQIVNDAIKDMVDCLDIMLLVIPGLKLHTNIMDRDIYLYVNSVDKINDKVQQGIPFREAYRQIASEIEQGRFAPGERAKHSHAGSIDNLSNDRIKVKLNKIIKETNITKYMNFGDRFIEKITKDHGIQK